jgi:hypothetical protein
VKFYLISQYAQGDFGSFGDSDRRQTDFDFLDGRSRLSSAFGYFPPSTSNILLLDEQMMSSASPNGLHEQDLY